MNTLERLEGHVEADIRFLDFLDALADETVETVSDLFDHEDEVVRTLAKDYEADQTLWDIVSDLLSVEGVWVGDNKPDARLEEIRVWLTFGGPNIRAIFTEGEVEVLGTWGGETVRRSVPCLNLEDRLRNYLTL